VELIKFNYLEFYLLMLINFYFKTDSFLKFIFIPCVIKQNKYLFFTF